MKSAVSLAIVVLVSAASAQAQFQRPEEAVKYRQSALFVMEQHLKRVGAMANGRVPYDQKVAVENADFIAAVAKTPWSAFVPGTDQGNTKAKAVIWSEEAKFKEAADRLIAETGKLAAAARAGNVEALKAAFGPTAASCKACHDNYRAQ